LCSSRTVDQWPAALAKLTGELTGIHDPVARRGAFRVPENPTPVAPGLNVAK